MSSDRWAAPQEISDILLAFPADVMDLMPDATFCEEELAKLPDHGRKWVNFQGMWFAGGIPEKTAVDLKDGVDGEMAFRHLKAIQGSFQPKHEHKVAGVAYLASRWFHDIAYDGNLPARKES